MSSSETDRIAKQLLARDPPPLEPKKVYLLELAERIAQLPEHEYVKAALHLANDDIHHAHLIAQANEGDSTANLIHATLHRREGDYLNSKYWWSDVVNHPLAPKPGANKTFVDECEKVSSKPQDDPSAKGLRERQWEELKGLLKWTRENCKSA